MVRQINIDRTWDKVVRIVVGYKNDVKESKCVESFDELTEEEMTFFKENAKNMWLFGSDAGENPVYTYIVNPYETPTICSR